jgi:hypothetical protein
MHLATLNNFLGACGQVIYKVLNRDLSSNLRDNDIFNYFIVLQ